MIVASEVPASEFGVKGVKAMTTVSNRPNNTAHFVVDVQAGVLQEAHERDTVDANICFLAGAGFTFTEAAGGDRRGETAMLDLWAIRWRSSRWRF